MIVSTATLNVKNKIYLKDDLQKLRKLIEVLENDDDVQKVHHNYAGEL